MAEQKDASMDVVKGLDDGAVENETLQLKSQDGEIFRQNNSRIFFVCVSCLRACTCVVRQSPHFVRVCVVVGRRVSPRGAQEDLHDV